MIGFISLLALSIFTLPGLNPSYIIPVGLNNLYIELLHGLAFRATATLVLYIVATIFILKILVKNTDV
jgi:hypothetical protein